MVGINVGQQTVDTVGVNVDESTFFRLRTAN